MANAINTLLSLRDAVRIQGPSTTSNFTTAINLGLLSNSALLNDRNYASPPPPTGNESRNSTPTRHYHHLENNAHRSPKISPQSIASNSPSSSTTRSNNNNTNNIGNNGNSNHHHNNNSLNWSALTNGHLLNTNTNLNSNTSENDLLLSPSEILVDELSYIYPQEDFTMLRKACLKNEITLIKLSSRYNYGNNGYPPTLTPSPSSNNNNINHNSSTNGGNGLKDDYMTQQTLQLIKQQNEYVQMLQNSGVNLPVFPGDMTMGASLNLSNLSTDHSNSKFPAWFHPLAHAAAGILPTTAAGQSSNHGNGKNINGGSNNINTNNIGNSRKKNSTTTDSHMFLSPKIPIINSNKPKTVAAALAASRPSPNFMGTNGGNVVGMGNGKASNNNTASSNNNNSNSGKRLSGGSRKRSQRSKPSTITRPLLPPPPPVIMDDDDIDPTSMLEVTTSLPNDNYCMDLTTERSSLSSSSIKGNDSHQLNLNSPPLSSSFSSSTSEHINTNGKSNGHNLLSAASLSLEHYLRNVLPNNNNNSNMKNNNNNNNNNNGNNIYNKSPSPTSSLESNPTTTSSSTAMTETISESDRKKQQVLEAFNFDPEVAGDARGLARKFGLNIRVVLKWLREGPSKSLPALLTKPPNGGLNLIMDNPMFSTMGDGVALENGLGSGKLGSATSANNNQKKLLPNKRKNTKPNQICDFQNDDLTDDIESSPLDMVVPIKKRRVSNSNNSNTP